MLVNGQDAPYFNVPRGLVRLRILNASLSRTYELRFEDERAFTLIAQDLGFLPQGKTLNVLKVAPSERVELLVDLNDGDNVSLIVGKKRDFIDNIRYFFGSSLLSAKVQQERAFHVDVTNATINRNRFDPRRLDVSAKLGSVERWTLTASAAVGFALRGVKFIVESINGKALEESEISWKDSVLINGTVTILVKFDNTSSNNYPFTFGASDLMLADKGCMGLMLVQ